MPFTTGADNIRLYYEEAGRGTPIVFLHGFTLDHRMWTAQKEYFSKQYRVIVHDSRGHGKSDAPPTNYSRDTRVEDLRMTLDQLGIDRCHLVGLSMGGSTGILFALKYPERLRSLALVSTGAAGWNVGKKISKLDEVAKSKGKQAALEQWLEWSMQWYKGKEQFRAIAQLMEEIMRDHSGAIWADPLRGKYPRMTDLEHVHKIKVPTLIMAGELDRVFVPLAKELHKKIEGSRYIMYPGVGHMINLEIPERFNGELGEWVG
ncbi:MAG: alpha/beta hydrolase [candidate division Zixibacteria bacterium]|nr:alpha/beta hydrolase [candidate division Zixibacteria bacterium]